VYNIQAFLGRKSSYKETKEIIENFHIVTHCNHSCWYPGPMLEAYKQYRPDWYNALMKIKDVLDKPGEDAAIEAIYETMEKGPTEEVTRHIMAAGEARIILLPFNWVDVGTWGSVYELFADGKENYFDGQHVVTVDTVGTLVKASNDRKLIAIAGIEDLVIVDTDDVLLIIPKNKIEKIKDIQAILNEQDKKEYL
jgi:mannose-1-phosphate guanylyltransferase